MHKLKRLEYLIGPDAIASLKEKTVLVAGVGGVGSFVCEALARSGVGKLIIVDFDKIDISNLNRQLECHNENIGASKVKEMAKRISLISDTKVSYREVFIDENFILDDCDYVIDCVDNLIAKFCLAKKASVKNIPFISSMGAAKRFLPENIKIAYLSQTKNDALAKRFRKLVKKEGFKKPIRVIYSDSPVLGTKYYSKDELSQRKITLGSSIMMVGSIGLMLAAFVIKELIGGNYEI